MTLQFRALKIKISIKILFNYYVIMEKKEKSSCTRLKMVAVALACVAVALGIASFLTPPRWIIDASVIAFAGEIFAFASLFFAWESVDRGIDAKIHHGETEIELNNPDHETD